MLDFFFVNRHFAQSAKFVFVKNVEKYFLFTYRLCALFGLDTVICVCYHRLIKLKEMENTQ